MGEHNEFTFLESVDEDMHDNILRLDQKLKGLLAEINAKIEALGYGQEGAAGERKEQLLALSDEVTKAINGIKRLVNLVVAQELSAEQFTELNQEALDELRELVKDSVEKITKIKEKF
jgi:hypothetical protein